MQFEDQQWRQIQAHLQSSMGDDIYASWLKPLKPISSQKNDDGSITLVVPTAFMRDWVLRHYTDAIRTAVHQVTGKSSEIGYIVQCDTSLSELEGSVNNPANNSNNAKSSSSTNGNNSIIKNASELTAQTSSQKQLNNAGVNNTSVYGGNNIDPRFTFDSFVIGKSNEFAYAAAKRIAESDDLSYNPFFLYGGVGLGKTHLMHAIAHKIKENFPQRKVLYVSSEKFMHNFIRALKDKDIMSFKETFRNVDVLMVDDVQFIAGKEATQEEFFHTFNELMGGNKQIILTADKSPHELSSIEERLRSRLGWGLATEIHKPNLETRIAILEQKASQLGVEITKDVAMFLADRIDSNVRELEGALNRLAAHAGLVNTSITIDLAEELLKDLFRVFNREVTIHELQKKVAEFYNIKMSDMSSSSRIRAIARPRQIAMYLCKTLTTKSYPEIGKAFGGRDHSTVMHACKAIEKLQEKDKSVEEDITLLGKMLSN